MRIQLTDRGVTLPTVHENAEPVWHLFVVRVAEREALQSLLKEEGIATGIHYPVPLHDQPAYEASQIVSYSLAGHGSARRSSVEPADVSQSFPSHEQIEAVCNTVAAAFAETGSAV